MLDDRAPLPHARVWIGWVLAVAWAAAVTVSFVLVNITDAGDGGRGAGRAADLYATLAIVPTIVLGAAALRSYGVGTRFGRAILLVVIGTVVWAAADTYYTFADVESYSSIADAGYLLGTALWGAAIIVLWRAVGIDAGDARSFWWFPVQAAIVLAVVVAPFGGNLLHLGEVSRFDATLSLVYLAVDVLLVHAAFVLWRRSFGFRPYHLLVFAATFLCFADLLYANRVASGVYDSNADPSDAIYALALGMLMIALAAFEAVARAEQRRRDAVLELARSGRDITAGVA